MPVKKRVVPDVASPFSSQVLEIIRIETDYSSECPQLCPPATINARITYRIIWLFFMQPKGVRSRTILLWVTALLCDKTRFLLKSAKFLHHIDQRDHCDNFGNQVVFCTWINHKPSGCANVLAAQIKPLESTQAIERLISMAYSCCLFRSMTRSISAPANVR